MTVTAQQRAALEFLEERDGLLLLPADTRQVAAAIERARGRSSFYAFTYDRAHSILKRMEGRGLVERLPADLPGGTARWRITDIGQKAIRP